MHLIMLVSMYVCDELRISVAKKHNPTYVVIQTQLAILYSTLVV